MVHLHRLFQLYADFPQVSQANVQNIFKAELSFYSPTFVALEEAILKTEAERGWKLMASSRKPGKGKGREIACLELETEKSWLSKNLRSIKAEKEKAAEAARKAEEEIASGAFFECGCCYGDSALSTLVMCSNGCQFCTECFTNLVASQVGLRKFVLPCMSVDGCASSFPEAEAERVLPPITMAALHKIKQEKEVDLADLEGLEKCPFCPFAMVLDNEHERLFNCQREDCGIVSCRQCKKEDHLPKTCAEMDSDRKIDGIHRVEEAMSEALIRRCPNAKCGEPYVKEDGCNKITCPSCRAVSCYICGIIVEGYSHFKNAGSNYTGPVKSTSNCELWDDSAKRNFQDVSSSTLVRLWLEQSLTLLSLAFSPFHPFLYRI
ncbi:hypothetical protein BCR35DRAFT_267719 [Leucosporidium creatinivorum]|uniref:RING-type domain-containing protein n=1 Tax=Leucosporidium creatinivorum TaxID=106004 RepID=A0A1Y2EWX5_9BASI|nr:hypothetical protein BCR35DRAFT_267719 [Leucosporidium creatinivorum]